MECPLCIDIFSQENIFQCIHCKAISCISCMKSYLLNSTKDPHCYQCRTSIHYDIFIDKFDKTWRLGKYKKHKEKILWDNEVSLLPQTVGYIQLEKELNDYYQEQNQITLDSEYLELGRQYKEISGVRWAKNNSLKKDLKSGNRIYTDEKRQKIKDKLKIIDEEYIQIKRLYDKKKEFIFHQRHIIQKKIEKVRDELYFIRGGNEKNKTKQISYKWNQKCLTPNCKSFLDKNGNCVICNHKYCMDCLEDITNVTETTPHVCNEETKNTVQMIQKESKPCPNCNELISKISGCDQMFCTLCGTAFSWTTGHIELGIIHNPHANRFFENNPDVREAYLQRMNGNENRDNNNQDCRQFVPSYIHIDALLKKLLDNKVFEYENNVEKMDDYTYYCLEVELHDRLRLLDEKRRSIYNFHHYMNPRYETCIHRQDNHIDHRILYLNNRITEKEFKTYLHKKYKRKSFITVLHTILVATSYIYSEFLWNIIKTERYDDFIRIDNMINEVTEETNKIIGNLLKKHNYTAKVMIVADTLEFPSFYD